MKTFKPKPCFYCNYEFLPDNSKKLFCSAECNFLSKFRKGPENQCWIWQVSKNKGYGIFRYNHKLYYAHRFSFEYFIGEIPENFLICHRCDVPACVNPAHLFIGTHLDNATDKYNKGRDNHAKGEKHGNSKLTEQQIIEIRTLTKVTNILKKEIAAIYDITPSHLSRIKNGRMWQHVP